MAELKVLGQIYNHKQLFSMLRLCAFILLGLTAYSSIAQEVNKESISLNKYTTGINYLKAEVINSNNQHLTVSVRWDKSWRDSENWDAAWIVLKGNSNGIASEHILISEKPEVVSNNSSAARGFRAVRTMENE